MSFKISENIVLRHILLQVGFLLSIVFGYHQIAAQTARIDADAVDWQSIIEQARAGQRRIVIAFCADQLEVCEDLAANCANSDSFQTAVQTTLLWLEVDANSLSADLNLGEYRVLRLPELMLFSPEGQPLARKFGHWEVGEMLDWAKADWSGYPERMRNSNALEWEALAELALEAAGFGYDASALQQRWLEGRPRALPLANAEWRMLFDAEISLEAPWFDFLLEHFAEMEAEWGYQLSDGLIVRAIEHSANASLASGDSLGLEKAFAAIESYYEADVARQLIMKFKINFAELHAQWDRYPLLCKAYHSQFGEQIGAVEGNSLAWNMYLHCPMEEVAKLGRELASASVMRDPQYWNLHTLASYELALDLPEAARGHAQKALQLCDGEPECVGEMQELLQRIPKRK